MVYKSLISFLMLAALGLVAAIDYCAICPDHTMCLYKPGDGPKCKSKTSKGLTAADKAAVLNAHNKYRETTAAGKTPGHPGATNMMKMTWDDQIAEVAQRWADQCTYAHDKCRNDPRFKVGQNTYTSSGKADDTIAGWNRAVDVWYAEYSMFPAANISPYKSVSGTGHYTQVVWATSKNLGCGFSAYGKTKLYVCNYGPRGNMNGEPIYLKGAGCAACPAGSTCNGALCA